MSAVLQRPAIRGLAWFALQQEIEDFLYREADLLDQRQFREWLDLLADDLVYFMPIRRNVKFGQHAEKENTRQGEGNFLVRRGQMDLDQTRRADSDRRSLR